MKMLVLGAGLQGSACAYDLCQNDAVASVTIADHHSPSLPAFLKPHQGRKLETAVVDVKETAALKALMAGHDAVMSAIPYYYNESVARAAVEVGLHFSDLGGNTEIVFAQKKLQDAAASKRISVVPDCGLAPGMVNILAAEGIRRLDRVDRVKIYVGGLPQHPEPPLNYQVVYSLEGALDYYTTPSWVLRDGKRTEVEALTEIEQVDFPAPVGGLEAFHTAGGISTMPWAWEGKVPVMEYKTLRYPGHAYIMKAIRDLGLIDARPIEVKGTRVVPRDVFIAAVMPHLHKPEGRDLVALRVDVSGTRNGKQLRTSFQLIDFYDAQRKISAMMRTTGYSLAITGVMQVDGRISAPGVHTPDEAVPFGEYVRELGERGVEIREVGD